MARVESREALTQRVFEILRDEILDVERGLHAAVEPRRGRPRLARRHPAAALHRGEHGRLGGREPAHAREPGERRRRWPPAFARAGALSEMRGPLVPLTGADCFLRAFDGEVAATTGASHLSQLVLRLGPGFDAERLRKLRRAAGGRARRSCARRSGAARPRGAGLPARPRGPRAAAARRGAPPARRAPSADARPLPDGVLHGLNEPPRRCAAASCCASTSCRSAGGAAGTDLALTWLHMLLRRLRQRALRRAGSTSAPAGRAGRASSPGATASGTSRRPTLGSAGAAVRRRPGVAT